MKKGYIKPTLHIEHYLLSESIAACEVDVYAEGVEGCSFWNDVYEEEGACTSAPLERIEPAPQLVPEWGPNYVCTCYQAPGTDFFQS